MTLNDSDLKDLFPSFLVRKRIRDVLLAEKNIEEVPVLQMMTPPRAVHIMPQMQKPLMVSPSTPSMTQEHDLNITVPYSAILEDPASYSEISQGKEKGMVVRSCMDQLIRNSGGRPTEHELLLTAKMIAAKYQCLRDNPEEPLRNNYSNLRLTLKRRMYNKTPAVTKRGRKPGWNTPQKQSCDEQPDCQPNPCPLPEPAEPSTSQSSESTATCISQGDKDLELAATNHNEQQGEDFLKELRKCGEKSNKDTVWRILQKTIDVLEKEVFAVPQKNRIEFLFENYPVFKNPIHLIQHLANILPEATLMKVRQNLRTATEKILDYLFSKNMVNVSRSALIDDEVKTLVAFVHLPKIGGKGINSGGKLSLHHTLIHAVKNEELPAQVAAEHKPYNSPWIMHQRFGQKTTLLLMYRDIIISKVETPADGILALMGIHYAAMAPYSVPLNGALLYIQSAVLEDVIHTKDKPILRKMVKEIDSVVKSGTIQDVLV